MQAEYASGEAVQATVTFADVLGLPIDIDRLHCSLIGANMSLLETSMAVDELVAKGRLVRRDDLVCLSGHEHVFAHHREAAKRAAELWPVAEKWAQRVGRIPFVRMVAVSGGLAVDAIDPSDPIDFFVVVRPRRLWTTRALVAKLLDSAQEDGVEIRPVYMTTTRAPEMAHQSVFVAWELAHLAVVVGESVSRTLRRSNSWMFDVLPNATLDGNQAHQVACTPSSTQKWTESLLLLPPFRLVEHWTRSRQLAQLRQTRSRQGHSSTTPPHRQQFSPELCDEHLGARATDIEQAWKTALNDV